MNTYMFLCGGKRLGRQSVKMHILYFTHNLMYTQEYKEF